MKIQVTSIPDEGLEVDFTQEDGWVREKVSQALKERHHSDDLIEGQLSVTKTMQNLSLTADMHLPVHATCDRCLKNYDYEIDVHCDRLLAPLFTSDRQREIEKGFEKEITKEDVKFSYFEGEEIDVGEILGEQIVLDQPMIYLCKPDCKGLCPQCGVNRNEQSCSCAIQSLEESPFAALKNLFKK
jgi:uncharacterized protein